MAAQVEVRAKFEIGRLATPQFPRIHPLAAGINFELALLPAQYERSPVPRSVSGQFGA
jgi:hypothetical protein